MGGKKGKQVSTGLTPMMNRSHIGDQTSRPLSDMTPSSATSPSKKSTDRPRRNAKAVATVRIANHSDAATPPQATKKARKDRETEQSPSKITMTSEELLLPPRIVVEGQEDGVELEWDEEEIIVLRAGEEPDQRPPRMKRKKAPGEVDPASGGNWRKRSMDTPKQSGGRPSRVARMAREDRDASYGPAADDVAVEESDDEEEETSSSEESEQEDEEVQQMRLKRQRGDCGKGDRGAAATPTAAAAAATPARGKYRTATEQYRLQLEKDDEEDEAMDVSEAPSSLAAALDRLAVYRGPRGTLLCREAECAQIKEFIRAAIATNGISQAACFISGVPGTGKTASVTAMVEELRAAKGSGPFVFLRVNASDPERIFTKLWCEYKLKAYGQKYATRYWDEHAREYLDLYLGSVDRERPPVLLLVDEIDHLSTTKLTLLRHIFRWSAVKAARVSIIYISTLALLERMFNQSLKMGINRVVFQVYSEEQIERIVLAKLCGAVGRHEDAIISPRAVEIAASKAAAISGDLRKATDILRAAIEMAMRKGEQRLTSEQVKEVIRESEESLLVQTVRSLSRHQKMVFEAVVDMARRRGGFNFPMADLVEKYESTSKMVVHDGSPLNYDSFRVIMQVVGLDLVRISNWTNRAIIRRNIQLVPAVHDAVSALKIVAQEKAEEDAVVEP